MGVGGGWGKSGKRVQVFTCFEFQHNKKTVHRQFAKNILKKNLQCILHKSRWPKKPKHIYFPNYFVLSRKFSDIPAFHKFRSKNQVLISSTVNSKRTRFSWENYWKQISSPCERKFIMLWKSLLWKIHWKWKARDISDFIIVLKPWCSIKYSRVNKIIVNYAAFITAERQELSKEFLWKIFSNYYYVAKQALNVFARNIQLQASSS